VAPEKRLALIAESYLSALHRDDPGHGCSIPTLGAEIARESPKTRKAFAGKLDEMIEMMADFIPNMPRKAARKQAIATLATMAGTMLLARIAGSSELSDEVLKAGRDTALDSARREPAAKKPREKQN
jgi:TetR/AcrR family transcriptional repressor of nem operon